MDKRTEALSARRNRKQGFGMVLARSAGLGMALALLLGTTETGAQAAKAAAVTAPVAQAPVDKAAKEAPAAKGEFTSPLVQKAETPETKARRESNAQAAKALQAKSDQLTVRFMKMAGEREVARKAEEKARKTRVEVVPVKEEKGDTSAN